MLVYLDTAILLKFEGCRSKFMVTRGNNSSATARKTTI